MPSPLENTRLSGCRAGTKDGFGQISILREEQSKPCTLTQCKCRVPIFVAGADVNTLAGIEQFQFWRAPPPRDVPRFDVQDRMKLAMCLSRLVSR